MPNQEQVLAAVRWFFATIGPLLVTWGYATDGALAAVSGVLVSLIPLIWGFITNRQTALIAKVAAMPEVKKVVANPTIANDAFPHDPKVTTS